MGIGKTANLLHLIDFGLSKEYRDPQSNEHIPLVHGKSLIGTARYASKIRRLKSTIQHFLVV